MRSLSFITLSSLGMALATIAAPDAGAQSRAPIIVCRDGTRVISDDARSCARHRGVDVRATDDARRYEERRTAGRRGDGRGRDDRNGYDPRYDGRDDRRSGDPRYDGRDDRRGNGGLYDNGRGLGRNAVYEWAGTVDKEIQIQIRGNRASVQHASGEMRNGRGRVVNGFRSAMVRSSCSGSKDVAKSM